MLVLLVFPVPQVRSDHPKPEIHTASDFDEDVRSDRVSHFTHHLDHLPRFLGEGGERGREGFDVLSTAPGLGRVLGQ